MSHDFSGRVAVVTGGGSGIGRAAAVRFAEAGAAVLVADRDADSAAAVVDLILTRGGSAASEEVDVTVPEQVERMVDVAVSRFGRLDFGVNSAGIGGARSKTADHPVDSWRHIVEVNLIGVFLSMRSEIPAILGGGDGGAIVNLASVAGVMGYANHSAYAASKHGVIGITRSAALEYAKRGLRVNAVCPAFTRTPMVDRLIAGDPEREAKLAAANPIGRLGTPDEVAASILYLCSDAAAFVTGQTLVLDGGLSIG